MLTQSLAVILCSQVSQPRSGTLKSGDLVISYSIRLEVPAVPCWGFDSQSKKRPLAKFNSVSVKFKNVSCLFPASAFLDLTAIREVKIGREKEQAVVTIQGGDAATGYTCKWVFSNGQIVKRIVRDSEFPENFWEETKYIRVTPNN